MYMEAAAWNSSERIGYVPRLIAVIWGSLVGRYFQILPIGMYSCD